MRINLFACMRISLLAFAVLLCTALSAQTPVGNSEITDITVFLSGAQVTRQVRVALNAGENRLRINGLTRHVRSNSVQVTGNPDYVIQSVKHELNYLDNIETNERVLMLEQEREELMWKRSLRQSLRQVYEQEKDLILQNKKISGSDDVLLAEDIEEVADFFRERLTEIEYKLAEILQEENQINQDVNEVNRELEKLGRNTKLASSFVDVVLDASKAGNMLVEVSYMVNAAAWVPAYDVRAKDADSPLDLVYNGRVIQYTEVDWSDVNLTLSTGNPAAGGVAPELNPWYLYLQELQAYKAKRQSSYNQQVYANQASGYEDKERRADEPAALYYSNPLIDKSEAGNASMSVSAVTNTLTTEFDIPVKYDIPADNQYYDVEMRRITLNSYYEHYAVPKLDKEAFLLAGVTEWEQYALLPGVSNIYFQGTYVGEGFIDPAVTGDTLQISLGRDKSVPIKRETVTDLCKTTTFGGKKTTTKAFRIETRNNKSVPVTLTVEDQVPISSDNSIEVSVEELSGADYDEESGLVTWTFTLQPGEMRTLDLRFVVKYPKKKVIDGL